MAESTIWWLRAGGAVALELADGHLLPADARLGLAAAALAAHAGASFLTVQLVAAAVVGGGAVAVACVPPAAPAGCGGGCQPHVNLDVGETVHIDLAPDGTARSNTAVPAGR
jgi:hypothetical protein